jgi:hypothetical protein
MRTYTSKSFLTTYRIKTLLATVVGLGLTLLPSLAMAGTKLKWSDAMKKGGDAGDWVQNIIYAVMAIFIMSSIIMGSLAFKQLAADGNWKDFWSKIAGAVGMFVTPIAVYWALALP